MLPSEDEGFPPEEGYIPDLAAILSSPDVHGLVGELATARSEIQRLEGELADLRALARVWMGDWRLVRGRKVGAMAVAELVAFARLNEASKEWT